MVDPRTGLTNYYFDAEGDWLSTSTNFGVPFTITFWGCWAKFNTWSRIFDSGLGQDKDNILIANHGGARHFHINVRKGNKWR